MSNQTKKIALIISLNFRVAHVAHLVASYRQMNELGYESFLYIHKDLARYLPQNVRFITSLKNTHKVNIAIFWFPAKRNLQLMWCLKRRYKSKIIYILHEPLDNFRSYLNSGMDLKSIISVYAKYAVSLCFVKMADYVILPSNKALILYRGSILSYINKSYGHLPLLFFDENINMPLMNRQYFSYIGTITQDHAYNEFITFISTFAKDVDKPGNIKFLIATRNIVERNDIILQLEHAGLLKIIDGHPLSDVEINMCYAKSIAVWNAYHRTTQSGVLAKASMFGTPALVRNDNLSEFSIEGYNVVCCSDNKNYAQLKDALMTLLNNFEELSANSRKMFENHFSYKRHNIKMMSIIDKII